LRRGTYSGDGVEVYWDFSEMRFDEIDTSDDSFEDDATPF
jgi:hypothetical protein